MGGKSMKETQDNDYLGWDTLASDVLVIDKVLFLNLVTFYILKKKKHNERKDLNNKKETSTRNNFNKKSSGSCKEIILLKI